MAFGYNVGRPGEVTADILALEQEMLESVNAINFYAKRIEELKNREGLEGVAEESLNGMFSDAVKKIIEWIKKFCDQIAIWCKKIYGRSIILASKVLDRNRLSILIKKNLTPEQQKEFGTVLVHTLSDDAIRSFQRATAIVNSKATGFSKRVFAAEDQNAVDTMLFDAISTMISAMSGMFYVVGKDGEDLDYTKENCYTRVEFYSKSVNDGPSSDEQFYEDRTGFSMTRINLFENTLDMIYKAETSFVSEAGTFAKSGISKVHKLQRESEANGAAPELNIVKKQTFACALVEKAATSACDQMAGVIYYAINSLREQLADKFPDKDWGNHETDTAGGSTLM